MSEKNQMEARNAAPDEEDIVTLDEVKLQSASKVPPLVELSEEKEEAEASPEAALDTEVEAVAPKSEVADPSKRNWDRGIKSLTWKERFLGISQSRFALVLLSVTLSAILMGADYGSRSFGYMLGHALLVLTLGRCLFLLYKDATGHSFVEDIRQRLTGGRERSW